jgi:ketosteroid isomerase-like protein
MSQENVERARAAIDAYNREGPEAFFELLDPEVEWVTDRSDLGRSTFRGVDGVRKSFDELSEALSDLRFEVSELREAGDCVVGLGHLRGRFRATGIEGQLPFGLVLTIGANGKLVRYESFLDPRKALEAAGLPE